MKRLLYSIFITVLVHSLIHGQYVFDHYTKEDGLLNNYVEEVFECSRGFQWIISHKGLSRYNGNSFENIPIPEEKRSFFLLNDLRAIDQDSTGNLWIGSMGGVAIYSPIYNTWSYLNNTDSKIKLSSDFIEDIVVASNNEIWIATQNGLNQIRLKDSTNKVYNQSSFKHASFGNYIYDLLLDSQKRLWYATSNGAGFYSYAKKTFFPANLPLELNASRQINVRCIYEDSKQNIWIGVPKVGIFILRKGNLLFEKIHLHIKNIETTIFSSICEDIYGKIWISTFVDGLYIADPKTNNVIKITEDSTPPYNISGNSIDRIKKDTHGNMWLGTHGGGISVYRPLKHRVEHYTKKNNGLSGQIVSCFEEEDSTTFWIGTDGGGFNLFDYTTKTFKIFNTNNGLPSNAVLDLEQINDTYLAIATWNGGLSIFNKKTKKINNYYYNKTRSENNIQYIYFDPTANSIWCATQNKGIQIFDLVNKQFLSEKQLTQHIPQEFNNKFILKFSQLPDSSIMLASTFFLHIVKNRQTTTFDNTDSSLACNTCTFPIDLFKSSNNQLYIASQNGLFGYGKNSFEKIMPHNNTLSDLKAITEDSFGNIWITSDKSLFKYSPKKNKIEDMGKKWGIPTMSFFRQSAKRLGKSLLFFGGENGFIIIDENENFNSIIDPPLFITNIYIHNKKHTPGTKHSVLSKDISFTKELILKHNEAYVGIDYSALNYIDNKKTSYRYILEGFDKQWTTLSQNKRITYTNIPQGKYTLKIQSSNSNGNWSTQTKKLIITVLPPWWKTYWFQAVFIVSIIIAIIAYIKFRERNIKRINNYLETKVLTRTEELRQINNELLKQKETIQSNYHELKEKQLVIQLKNKELQETISTKDKLITIIGHDFRNPLTALTGLINNLALRIKNKLNEEEQNILDSMGKSSNTLLSQMIDVLKWSSEEHDQLKFDPVDINIETLINDSLSLVAEMAKAKNITISLSLNYASSTYVDARMISAVLRNILTNSIKYTNNNGQIEIIVKENSDATEIIIKDTGIGIPQSKIDKIMESSTIKTHALSGFGLQICKSFIETNSGIIYIESQENKGTTIHTYLPKGNKDITPKVYKTYEYFNNEPTSEEKLELKPDCKSMLIIEDDTTMVQYMKSVFEQKYNVSIAFDGQEGFKKANSILPDIILSDVNMPFINGNELCKILKSNSFTSHIPIILISAKKMDSDELTGLKSGADDFIFKPFNEELLLIKTEKLTEQKHIGAPKGDPILEKLRITLPESIEDKFLKKTAQTIIDRISDPAFSVECLAEEVGMSRSQLYRKFKAVLGVSPMDYIKNIRLQKAMKLLITEKYRISEIAYEVGFSDYKYFTTCFTKTFGASPTNYLTKIKNKKQPE